MQRPEYLLLEPSSDPQKNLRATVIFAGDIGMISKREFPLATFLQALDLERMEMNFDDWPQRITRFDVDFVKRTIKIYAADI